MSIKEIMHLMILIVIDCFKFCGILYFDSNYKQKEGIEVMVAMQNNYIIPA